MKRRVVAFLIITLCANAICACGDSKDKATSTEEYATYEEVEASEVETDLEEAEDISVFVDYDLDKLTDTEKWKEYFSNVTSEQMLKKQIKGRELDNNYELSIMKDKDTLVLGMTYLESVFALYMQKADTYLYINCEDMNKVQVMHTETDAKQKSAKKKASMNIDLVSENAKLRFADNIYLAGVAKETKDEYVCIVIPGKSKEEALAHYYQSYNMSKDFVKVLPGEEFATNANPKSKKLSYFSYDDDGFEMNVYQVRVSKSNNEINSILLTSFEEKETQTYGKTHMLITFEEGSKVEIPKQIKEDAVDVKADRMLLAMKQATMLIVNPEEIQADTEWSY